MKLTQYQRDYRKVFEEAGFTSCRWDDRNTPYHFTFFCSDKNGKRYGIIIPCFHVLSEDGTRQGKDDCGKVLQRVGKK